MKLQQQFKLASYFLKLLVSPKDNLIKGFGQGRIQGKGVATYDEKSEDLTSVEDLEESENLE